MILPGDAPDSIAVCADSIRSGAIFGLPTETVYGLGANADDEAAVAKIFAAKGRPSDHPLIVHVAGPAQVAHYAAQVPAFARRLIDAFWPGPVTLILPRRPGAGAAAAGGQDSIGLRCPSHPVAQVLLHQLLNGPRPVYGIAAPSANPFGRVSPTTAAHVRAEFGPDLPILDGGPCDVGIESTIVDCTRGVPVLLRPGSLTRTQLQAACGQVVLLKEELPAHVSQAPKASGTLESHYAPAARLRLMHAKALQTALDMLGDDVDRKVDANQGAVNSGKPVIATWSRVILKSRSSTILRRRMPDDAAAAAHQLFAVLREFDARGVKLIWVETPPDAPEWDGVRDRLQRAAAS
jgi:L-threonylcarbamoyladenylate synthase